MNLHSVYPQIIMRKDGNSYLSTAGNFITHADLNTKISELLNGQRNNTNKYFVFEIRGNEAILRAAQKSAKSAMHYCYNNGDMDNSIIAHFDDVFLPYFPSELIEA